MNKNENAGLWWDYSWNPITGCSHASEGCDNCYAEAISRRFKLPWGKTVFHPERLGDPSMVRKPSRIFVCSMADLFHETVETEWRDSVYQTIRSCPWHTFILLTKRPRNALTLHEMRRERLPPNVWMGVTVENQARADERIPILLRIPAAVRFVSVEPMLGPVDLASAANVTYWDDPVAGINWVIAGPENGPGARACDHYEFEDLQSQCVAAGVPFFDKRPAGARREWPK